jgi:hypothetical protein
MRLLSAFLLTTFVSSAVGVTLRLWSDDESCSGQSCTCEDQAQQTCCFCDGQLFGSLEAIERNEAGDIAGPFSVQVNDPCAVAVTGYNVIPFCFISNTPSIVSGAAWNPSGSRKRDFSTSMDKNALKCTSSKQGHQGWGDETHHWTISHEKMEQLKQSRLAVPEDKSEAEAFFKEHADKVEERQQDVPIVRASDDPNFGRRSMASGLEDDSAKKQ